MSDAPEFETPEDAEAAFYQAFEAGDLDAMMQVWDDDDAVVCIHPLGERLVGREAIAESWRRIFAGGVVMRFEITDRRITGDDRVSVHCVTENINHGPRLRLRGSVLATNVYRLTRRGWRLVVHHGSPAGESDSAEEAGERPARLH